MNGPITNSLGVPAYMDTPPVACRDFGGHCANTSIGAVDYIAGADNCLAMGTLAPTAGAAVLYMVPFLSPPFACGIDRLAFEVTTAVAATQAYIGLFEDVDVASSCMGDALKPGRMLHDSGAIATTAPAALKTSTVTGVRLKPNRWYWLGYRVGIETTHATIRSIAAGGTRVFGLGATGSIFYGGLTCGNSVPGYENWGTSPELTTQVWGNLAAVPVLRYRLTT